MSARRDHSIYERLDDLAEYPTVSEFTEAYYELIADYLSVAEPPAARMQELFLEYLDIEESYHARLAVLPAGEARNQREWRHVTEKREIGLRVLLEWLERESASGRAEIARQLLIAECCYHLKRTDRVVAHVERAIELGARHPLVQFVLGYNRFELANQAYMGLDEATGHMVIYDRDRYRLACLTAVNAFQAGLTGDEFDRQLHWWIGVVLRAAGFEEAAEASLRRAAEEKAQAEAGWEGLVELESLGPRWEEDLGPITPEEVDEVTLQLRRPHLRSELN